VIRWIAAGLQSDEINGKTAQFDEPFSVSRQQVDYYRKSYAIDLEAMKRAGREDALTEGLALKSERVRKLKQLAALMEQDIFGGLLWTTEIKGVGSGDIAEIVEFEEFNGAEVVQYRGVLDDIAKEVGERVQKSEVSGKDGGPIKIDDERQNRAISTLADAIREAIPGTTTGGQGSMDATEQAAVVGTPEPGR